MEVRGGKTHAPRPGSLSGDPGAPAPRDKAAMVCKPGELKSIFPTVVLARRLDTIMPMNRRLHEIVLERELVDPGIGVSNVGGWHSQGDLMNWDYPEIRALMRECFEAGRDMTQASLPPGVEGEIRLRFNGGCWANLLRDGGYNTVHNHAAAVWSGCYYVSLGDPDPQPNYNGWIEFQDPRPANIHSHKEKVRPEAGLLLLFPGWLNHYVNPFRGRGERISIAFNFDVEVVPHKMQASDLQAFRQGTPVG